MSTGRQLLLGALVSIALLLLVVSGARQYIRTRPEARAKMTTTRMSRLMNLLQADKPATTTPEDLLRLLAKYGRSPDYLRDDWGQPLLVERLEGEPSQASYKIISLGRDGKRGACCEKWVADPASDAVLLNGDWLQVWSIPNWP